MSERHTHQSPTLDLTAVQWPHPSDDPTRITLQPGDWLLRGIVRTRTVQAGPDALHQVLQYALAALHDTAHEPHAHPDETPPATEYTPDWPAIVNRLSAELTEEREARKGWRERAEAADADARRLLAVVQLCSGRPGYHTLTVKQLLTAISDAEAPA